MFDPKKFTTPIAKPLPIVLLLDVSQSMSGDKIGSLNQAVKEMLGTFAKEAEMSVDILVSIITFGPAQIRMPFTKASDIKWTDLVVEGSTPIGEALEIAKGMIECKETTPSRAYRPTVILVSDGQPTDAWGEAMEAFVSSGRSSKCDRMAMAIGEDASKVVLERFIEETPHDLFYAKDAASLHEFFQRVTMSVTMRTQSKNPNVVPVQEDVSKLSTASDERW